MKISLVSGCTEYFSGLGNLIFSVQSSAPNLDIRAYLAPIVRKLMAQNLEKEANKLICCILVRSRYLFQVLSARVVSDILFVSER